MAVDSVRSVKYIQHGAMSLLHRLERDSKIPGARDGTDYHRRGPQTLAAHYGQLIHCLRRRARSRLRHRRADPRRPLARRTH